MPVNTRLTQLLGLSNPIVQAPMAGGTTTVELVSAVTEAGALGSFGAAYLTPEQILAAARSVRSRTDRPFAINLFAPVPEGDPVDPAPALRRMAEFHQAMGLPAPQAPGRGGVSFEEQAAAVLESGASVLSFTFGLPPEEVRRAAKAKGVFLIGTATTVEEAMLNEAAGMDAVVAQGSEAGGHRGTFAADFAAAMIGTMALVPQVADAVKIPVLASGGVMDGRGIAAALALGASGVQMGTAFVACDEAGSPEAFRRAVLDARETDTRVTRAFSGRPARGIANAFMDGFDRHPEEILPYPVQNALTRPLRTAAAQAGRAEFLSLWSGQGVRLARREPAAELVRRLARETDDVLRRLRDGTPSSS